MRTILVTISSLKYDFVIDSVGKFPVLDAFIHQSNCFHNFRVPTPYKTKNLDFIKNSIKNKYLYYKFSSVKDLENMLNKDHNNIWVHFPKGGEDKFAMIDCILRSMFDYLDEKNKLDDVCIVLMGTVGNCSGMENYGNKCFPSKQYALYDYNVHVPLMIYHTKYGVRDIFNSICLSRVCNFLNKVINDENSLLDEFFVNNSCLNRDDIYTVGQNSYGIRGPMFQYFCRIKEGVIEHQELYDLNNDYKMKNDLFLRTNSIGKKILHLAECYKERIVKKYIN